MKNFIILLFTFISAISILMVFNINYVINCKGQNMTDKQYKKLTPEEERVIIHKGTEQPFTGKYYDFWEKGTYVCKRCGTELYSSESKFDAQCGWPSFDDEIPGAIKKQTDADGYRTEILCNNCGAHLGHVFYGEGFTPKNTRHCVNSISIEFIPDSQKVQFKKAYFAGGCFWGVEHLFQQLPGVVNVKSGYMGGHTENPKYEDVCFNNTGHAETVEIIYNPNKISYRQLAKFFFEIHDPTQLNRQGPDIGDQYRSVIFYNDESEKQIAEELIQILRDNGYPVVTQVVPVKKFYEAEDYHQDYYKKTGKKPYCHFQINRFD